MVHLITILCIMLSFSTPISAMYSRILKRLSDDITTKRRDIAKITKELRDTYLKYIKMVRFQQKNQSLFQDLEYLITGKAQPQPGPVGILLDNKYAQWFSDEEIFFQKNDQPELIGIIKAIEQFQIAFKDKVIYNDLYESIQTKLGIDVLEKELTPITSPFLDNFFNTKNLKGLKNFITKVDDYRKLTSNTQAFHDLYDHTLRRIDELKKPKIPPKPPKKGGLVTQANTKGLFLGQKNNVLQVKVYPQGKARDGGASCGYHSLKNNILIMRAIVNKEDIASVNAPEFVANLIGQPGNPGIWRDIIIKKNYQVAVRWFKVYMKKPGVPISEPDQTVALLEYINYLSLQGYAPPNDKGEWLSESDIKRLVQFERDKGFLSDRDIVGVGYTVIENIPMMQTARRDFSLYDDVSKIAQKIKRNNNYLHGFSVGLMGYYTGGQAHWISLVVNKVNGKVQFIVADSRNKNIYDLKKIQNNVVRILIEELSR